MSVIYIMIPVALALAGLAVWGFILATRSGQFDDLDTPPLALRPTTMTRRRHSQTNDR